MRHNCPNSMKKILPSSYGRGMGARSASMRDVFYCGRSNLEDVKNATVRPCEFKASLRERGVG